MSNELEYGALMNQARDAERTAQLSWLTSGVAAAVTLSWAIGARSSGLMLPVVVAVAYGFYVALRARQQAKLVAAYMEDVHEAGGSRPQWFSRVRQLNDVPGYSPAGDWVATCLANAVVVMAATLAWSFTSAAAKTRGDLMAGIVTGCGVAFAFYSITETAKLARTNVAAMWAQAGRSTSRRAA